MYSIIFLFPIASCLMSLFDWFHYIPFFLSVSLLLPLICLSFHCLSSILHVFFSAPDFLVLHATVVWQFLQINSHKDWLMQCCISDWWASLWKASLVPMLLFFSFIHSGSGGTRCGYHHLHLPTTALKGESWREIWPSVTPFPLLAMYPFSPLSVHQVLHKKR